MRGSVMISTGGHVNKLSRSREKASTMLMMECESWYGCSSAAEELDTPNIRCENFNMSTPPGGKSSVLLYLQKSSEK